MRSRQRWSRLQFWPFQLQTDASDSDVGAVLLQEGHPLAIVSKSLAPHTRLLSIYEEYLAILVAVEQWRSYLQHVEFAIYTDQHSLMHVTDQRLHTQWQLKMHHKLAGLQYKVIYKPGRQGPPILLLMLFHDTRARKVNCRLSQPR